MKNIHHGLGASACYAAGYALGQRARRARNGNADIASDTAEYVTRLYANYANYEIIKLGFVQGYTGAAMAIRELREDSRPDNENGFF